MLLSYYQRLKSLFLSLWLRLPFVAVTTTAATFAIDGSENEVEKKKHGKMLFLTFHFLDINFLPGENDSSLLLMTIKRF